MTERLIGTFTLFLLLGSRPAALPGQSATPEDSVRAAEMARGQALLHADTVALSRMIADEFVEISRLGTLRTRAANIHDIVSGYTRIFVRRDGRWQAVAMQQTSMQ